MFPIIVVFLLSLCRGQDVCAIMPGCSTTIQLQDRMSYLESTVMALENMVYASMDLINDQAQEIVKLEGITVELQYDVAKLEVNVQELEAELEDIKANLPEAELPASCQQLADWGKRIDGEYTILPSLAISPFKVECKFSGNVGTTVVKHDHEGYGITATPGQPDGCAEPGCFKQKINYAVEMTQMESLINLSAECHQSIVNNCTNNALTHTSWWTDRKGNKVTYWHGDYEAETEGCFCSLEGAGCQPTAVGAETICECDSFTDPDIDAGTLANKNQLPVAQLNYGGSDNRFSWILFHLGFLECSGKSPQAIYPSELADNDFHFRYSSKQDDTMTNGAYIAMPNVDFDRSLGAYELESGIFTVPVSGKYVFTISLETYDNRGSHHQYSVNLRVGDEDQYGLFADSQTRGNGPDSRYLEVELDLAVGQKVGFFVNSVATGTRYGEFGFISGKMLTSPNQE